MIIGPDFVYLHVPKTAGSSFEKMMERRHGLKAARQHDTARDIPLEHRDKFIFGFMREPVDAEVSNWRYHRSSWKHNAFFTFENWCHWRHNNEKEYGALMGLPPDPVEYGHVFNVRPQAGYFVDENGQCIADNIYRFSELDQALEDISDRIGLDCSLPVDEFQAMRYGWSGVEDYNQYVTPQAERILRKHKSMDFLLWESNGDIPTDYWMPTVPNYAYTR